MILLLLSFSSEDDRHKFEFIYEKYKNLMLYKARLVLHDQMLAEDAVSEAFMRIYRNLDKIEDASSPRGAAFIMTILKNCALSILKKGAKQSQELFEDALLYESASEDTAQIVISSLTEREIYDIVETLGEQTKAVFICKYAYDMSHGEIGRLLGISENNVTVRLHRARKKLADALGEGATAI